MDGIRGARFRPGACAGRRRGGRKGLVMNAEDGSKTRKKPNASTARGGGAEQDVPRRCETVGKSLVDAFVSQLARETRQSGDRLSIDRIRELAENFKEIPARKHFLFEVASEECCHEVAEEKSPEHEETVGYTDTQGQAVLNGNGAGEQAETAKSSRKARRSAPAGSPYDRMRTRPFDRFMVARFAHLFPPREGDEGDEETAALSRRMIPGFVTAITMMIGAERYERFQERCREIVERYRDEDGIHWDEAYADPDAQRLVLDILTVMARYFERFDRRQEWLIQTINNNLDKVPENPRSWERTWRLSERAFFKLMNALFLELRRQVMTSNGALEVKRRHGAQVLKHVHTFFEELDRRSTAHGVRPVY